MSDETATRRVVFATRNRGKLVELAALVAAPGLRFLTLDEAGFAGEVDEDRPTLDGNATKKAVEVARATGLVALADDSGLEVDALDGAPGVRSARYAGEPRDDARNNAHLLAALAHTPAPRTARFRCVLALARPDGTVQLAHGACDGEILVAPRGTGGFGYDPLFFLPALGRTMAELSVDEKNRLSHRSRAMRAMLPLLLRELGGAPPDVAR